MFKYLISYEYGNYSHRDTIGEYDTFDEALKTFMELCDNPGEDDDAYELQLVNFNELTEGKDKYTVGNGVLISPHFDEYETLLEVVINEYED